MFCWGGGREGIKTSFFFGGGGGEEHKYTARFISSIIDYVRFIFVV